MSVNRSLPHVLVLPEDDANRQIATGLKLELDQARMRQMQVLPVAGGWRKVLDAFKETHIAEMDRNPQRLMVLLIDLDGQPNRLETAKTSVPEHLAGRVFILGAWSEPERLKPDLGTYESIGRKLAKDCRDGTDATWRHPLLHHNVDEVGRLRERVWEILFQPD